jgi:Flp pilus assembly protein TadD
VVVLATTLAALAGCGGREIRPPDPAWPGEPGQPRVEIIVDFTRTQFGRVPVTMRVLGVDGKKAYNFRLNSKNDEYRYYKARFTNAEGHVIPAELRGTVYHLPEFEGDTIEARWETEPGGLGRHGMQGVIRDDFASFDGRLFLLPRDVNRLVAARIHYVLPEDWSVSTPFRKDGDWYYLDTFGEEEVDAVLRNSCVGAGRFDIETRTMGEMDVRVASFSDWNEAYKKETTDKTFRILQYYHDTFGFDLRAPYNVVWTPRVDRRRVHGGAEINGTCLENPSGDLRPLQLLTHRVAHSLDKYKPAGMKVARSRDRWFREGWPSYMEVEVTEAVGIAEAPSFYDSLYKTYKQRRVSHPGQDIALAEESGANKETEEFIHYKKAPLVAKMLAAVVRERSEHTLEEFMREMWAKFGWYQGAFSLRNELEAFTGESFDDFWEIMVDGRGVVIPVWKSYLTDEIRRAQKRRPALRVGGEPVSGEYVHFLASTGRFKSWSQVRDYLVNEEARRRQLLEQGIHLYPEELRRHLFAIPPEDRYAVSRFESLHPLDPLPASAKGPAVEIYRDHGDGSIFAELLDLERDYMKAKSSGRFRGMELRDAVERGRGRPRLAFGVDAALDLEQQWSPFPSRVRVEMSIDGQSLRNWFLVEPGSIEIATAPRLAREGLLRMTLTPQDGDSVTRGFWQRGLESRRGHRRGRVRSSRTDPDNADAWFRDGVANLTLRKYKEALPLLTKAVEMDTTDPQKWYKQGEALARMNRHEEAVKSFNRSLTLQPQFVGAAGAKALSLVSLRRTEEAREALDVLIRRNPKEPVRMYWSGRVHESLGEMDEAEKAYRTYASLQPRRPEAWRQLGQCRVRMQKYDEAADAFDRAVRLDPSDDASRRARDAARNAHERGER